MQKQDVIQRFYKISINLGPIYIYNNSKVYEIKVGNSTIIPGLPYSILSILFGWWGFNLFKPLRGIKNTLEALHVNFSGGEDITKLVVENEFDDKTNFIFNNLQRKTTEKINREDIEIIIEIQEEFLISNDDKYSDANSNFIIQNLSKLDIKLISREEIQDIFNAMRIHDKYC